MKNLFLLLALSTSIIFTSCEGPTGPPGINILGKVFETTVNFNAGNNFSRLVNFPTSIEVYESDVVLVYLLEETISGDGGPIDIWSQLPQTYFLDQGTLLYSFDHTFLDVNLFLDGNFNLTTLSSNYTDNQIFRIAVVPSEYGNANLTMEELLYDLQMDTSEIEVLPN